MPDERRIHDYRRRGWGHDYTITPDADPVTAQLMGWGVGIRQRDVLLIPHSQGDGCLYEVEQIKYFRDPADMWKAACRFVAGSGEAGQLYAAAMQAKPVLWPYDNLLASWWVLEG